MGKGGRLRSVNLSSWNPSSAGVTILAPDAAAAVAVVASLLIPTAELVVEYCEKNSLSSM